MIIIILLSHICAFAGLTTVWSWLSLNVKKQEMETQRLSIKRGEPPGHLSSAILPLLTLRESAWKREWQAEFHVAHKSWPLITLLRSLVLPGPSGIEDLLIVLVLNLYPLGINPMSPFGWIYHGCSQLNPFGNSNDFSCYCCLHKAKAITSSISAPSPEILEALITVQWKRMMLNSF